MTGYRVPGRGRVDARRPVGFTFDGVRYQGAAGDTVASALLANGVHLMGRSFKYHRPRGPVAAGSEEPNALIGTRRGVGRFEPNTRATVQEIWAGSGDHVAEQVPEPEVGHRRGQRRGLHAVLGGLLLQDLHVAEELLAQGLRAVHPRRRRSGRQPDGGGPGHLRLALPALRRADRGRWSRRARRRARRCRRRAEGRACRRELRSGGHASVRAAGADRRQTRLGLAGGRDRGVEGGGRADHDANDRHRVLSPEHDRHGRKADRPSLRTARGHAARADVAGAGETRGAGAGCAREAARVPRQRQARRDAGGGGADLPQPLRRAGRKAAGGSDLA